MSSTLLGKNYATEAEVIAVPNVPFTKTFHPVHHREVIAVVKEGLSAVGLGITKSEYVLAQNGLRMFGVYDLDTGTSELSWSIGIRNSMNKSLSIALTAGTRVFVCENLCFSGEFLAFRRHTSGLDMDELSYLTYRSVRRMIPLLHDFQRWHESLKHYPLSEADARILLVEVLAQSIIPPSKFHHFWGLWTNVYCNSLWGFHEACTDVLKTSNLLTLPKKNKSLNQIIENYIDTLGSADHISSLGDFYQSRAMRSEITQ